MNAIVFGIQKLHYFVAGRRFIIFTDHRSLCHLDQKIFNNPKIERWQRLLMPYHFTVQYLEGPRNILADMLSRPMNVEKLKPIADPTPAGEFYKLGASGMNVYVPSWCADMVDENDLKLTKVNDSEYEYTKSASLVCTRILKSEEDPSSLRHLDLFSHQMEDEPLSKIINYLNLNGNATPDLGKVLDNSCSREAAYLKLAGKFYLDTSVGLLMVKIDDVPKIVVPVKLRAKYLGYAHDDSGHGGRDRVSKCLNGFYWEAMTQDVASYIDSCTFCSQSKGNYGRKVKLPSGHIQRGNHPFQIVFCDFVHMSPVNGFKYICTMQCSYSKFVYAIPCKRDRALDAARCLAKLVLEQRTIPDTISTDRGCHFVGAAFAEILLSLGIKQMLHVAWRPQSSGSIERMHRVLKNSIYMAVAQKNKNWVDVLQMVVSSMNAYHCVATGHSPFQVVTGRNPNMLLPEPPSSKSSSGSPAAYGMALTRKLVDIHHHVKLANIEADTRLDNRTKTTFKENIGVGDKVLVFREQSSCSKNTNLQWNPGYEVVRTNNLVFELENESGKREWVHRYHIRLVQPRPIHLVDDDEDAQVVVSTPVSDGKSVPKEVKVEPNPQVKIEASNRVSPPTPPSSTPGEPIYNSIIGEVASVSVEPEPDRRRSKRIRKKPDRLGIASQSA